MLAGELAHISAASRGPRLHQRPLSSQRAFSLTIAPCSPMEPA